MKVIPNTDPVIRIIFHDDENQNNDKIRVVIILSIYVHIYITFHFLRGLEFHTSEHTQMLPIFLILLVLYWF